MVMMNLLAIHLFDGIGVKIMANLSHIMIRSMKYLKIFMYNGNYMDDLLQSWLHHVLVTWIIFLKLIKLIIKIIDKLLVILSQMSLITNRSFLYVNCLSVDVSLKILLSLSEWFNACVATERMVSVIKLFLYYHQKLIKMNLILSLKK